MNNEPIFDCDIVDNREIQNESPSVNHETFDQEMLYVSLPELELHVQGLRPGGSEPESLSTSPSISATLMSGISSPDGQFSEDSHSSVTYDEMVLDSSVGYAALVVRRDIDNCLGRTKRPFLFLEY